MRSSMKTIIVCGEVILCGLLAAAVARGGDYPPISPTLLKAKPTNEVSPYASPSLALRAVTNGDRPVRVTLTNRLGQESTLEYHRPVKIADDMIPIDSLPIVSVPARAEDFAPQSRVQTVSYQYSTNYANDPAAPQVRYVGHPQPLPIVQTTAPRVVNYGATQYDLPNYAAPINSVPRTAYYPVQTTVGPVAQSNLQIGSGIYGQPVIYRPGQPVRNVWRWLTP